MEQHQSVEVMTGVKLYGARTGLDFRPGFEPSPPRLGPHVGRPAAQGSGLGASSEKAELLGLSFDAVTMEAAVARCLEFCRGPARFAYGHHGQRLAPVHDARRSGAGVGLPRGST